MSDLAQTVTVWNKQDDIITCHTSIPGGQFVKRFVFLQESWETQTTTPLKLPLSSTDKYVYLPTSYYYLNWFILTTSQGHFQTATSKSNSTAQMEKNNEYSYSQRLTVKSPTAYIRRKNGRYLDVWMFPFLFILFFLWLNMAKTFCFGALQAQKDVC